MTEKLHPPRIVEHHELPEPTSLTGAERAAVRRAWRRYKGSVTIRGDIAGPFSEDWEGWDEERNLRASD